VYSDPEKEFKKLISDLVTECTRCKCEIRVRELVNNAPSPLLCTKCRLLPKGARPLVWAISIALAVCQPSLSAGARSFRDRHRARLDFCTVPYSTISAIGRFRRSPSQSAAVPTWATPPCALFFTIVEPHGGFLHVGPHRQRIPPPTWWSAENEMDPRWEDPAVCDSAHAHFVLADFLVDPCGKVTPLGLGYFVTVAHRQEATERSRIFADLDKTSHWQLVEVYDDRRKAPLGVVQTSCQGEEFQKAACIDSVDRPVTGGRLWRMGTCRRGESKFEFLIVALFPDCQKTQ